MADTPKPGLTAWEMLKQRVSGSRNGQSVTPGLYNPLKLQAGSLVPVAYANGPAFSGLDFTVREIREYTREIDGQRFTFTDYVLVGVDRATLDRKDQRIARLRVVPNAGGTHDALLLVLEDEFAFAEDFLSVVRDEAGVLEIKDDATGEAATFSRINDVRASYDASVRVLVSTGTDPGAAGDGAGPLRIEYWDFWRDVPLATGGAAKEFCFVELNSKTGWFQIWRGREFFA